MLGLCVLIFAAAASLVVYLPSAAALQDGLARRPIMGFNTWNRFHCDINETIIRNTAKALVDTGLAELGYNYVNLDDCWLLMERDAKTQQQVPDPAKFPSGMKPLVDYIHSLGLKFGIYSDAGTKTCAGYPGSLGHEDTDAAAFASWGVDYLKYDNCYAPETDPNPRARYTAMRDALKRTGRDIVYSLCSWGVGLPWQWGDEVGHLWRTSADISDGWDRMYQCLHSVVGLSRFAGPGGWNDPDMLEVGNGGMTDSEYSAHFALWAILKAPLLIGTDITRMSNETRSILMAEEVIAVNQDPLGVAGDLVHSEGQLEVYAAPMADGSRAVVMLNAGSGDGNFAKKEPMELRFEWLGYSADTVAIVRDLYARKDLGVFRGAYAQQINYHGAAALLATPTHEAERDTRWRPWFTRPYLPPLAEPEQVDLPDRHGAIMGKHLAQGPHRLTSVPDGAEGQSG